MTPARLAELITVAFEKSPDLFATLALYDDAQTAELGPAMVKWARVEMARDRKAAAEMAKGRPLLTWNLEPD